MNTLDIVVLVVLTLCTLLGIYWGLIRQGLALVGLIVGIIMAGRYGPEVAGWLSSFSLDDQLIGALGFVLVLAGVSIVTGLIASLLRIFVGLLFLGWLDNMLGGLLGLAQGLFASAAVAIALVAFPLPLWTAALDDSRLVAPLLRIGEPLALLLPEMFRLAVRVALNS